MNKRITAMLIAAALSSVAAKGFADDVNATGNDNNVVKHPINAYNNHEVKEDIQDSQENAQKAKESKATYKQAKADYEKALKANGANSEVTKEAKSRKEDAYKDMCKYNKKTADANRELKKDEISAHQ